MSRRSVRSFLYLYRYFCVYISSPADELSCERGDQTQGAAEEAAGRLLWQVCSCCLQSLFLHVFHVQVDKKKRSFVWMWKLTYFLSAGIKANIFVSLCSAPLFSPCNVPGTHWPTAVEQAFAHPPMTRVASRWTTESCMRSNVSARVSFYVSLHLYMCTIGAGLNNNW